VGNGDLHRIRFVQPKNFKARSPHPIRLQKLGLLNLTLLNTGSALKFVDYSIYEGHGEENKVGLIVEILLNFSLQC